MHGMTSVIVIRAEGPEPGLLKPCWPFYSLLLYPSDPGETLLDPGSWENHQELGVQQSAGIVSVRSSIA